MSKKKLFWGITFIVAALIILADVIAIGAGWIDDTVLPVWKICLGLLCVIFAIWGIVHRQYWTPFPMLAALFFIFRRNLAAAWPPVANIPAWAIITGAALLSIGAGVLTYRKKSTVSYMSYKSDKSGDGADEKCYSKGTNIIYVDAAELVDKKVYNRIGALEIYFTNVAQYAGGGTLSVYNKMGAISIHAPEGWNMVNEIENQMGAVENKVPPLPEGKALYLKGVNKMGAVEIKSDAAYEA